MNSVLAAYGARPLATLGDLFLGRAVLLTYPELDIYPQRGPAEYYGIPESAEGSLHPGWPEASGPRVLAYVYSYYPALADLMNALEQSSASTLMMCRRIDRSLLRAQGSCLFVTEEPMSFTRLLPQCDLVVCHGSHQTTAQALLAGKPVLLLPTQLEQFLITRRVVRQGMGLGMESQADNPDFSAALRELSAIPEYRQKAEGFASRYRDHGRAAALATMVKRCEALL